MQEQGSNVLYGQLGKSYPLVTRGEGVYVFDENGKQYLDGIGGVGVVNIGYGVEEVVEAIARQARTLAYAYGGMVDHEPRRELARIVKRGLVVLEAPIPDDGVS